MKYAVLVITAPDETLAATTAGMVIVTALLPVIVRVVSRFVPITPAGSVSVMRTLSVSVTVELRTTMVYVIGSPGSAGLCVSATLLEMVGGVAPAEQPPSPCQQCQAIFSSDTNSPVALRLPASEGWLSLVG